MLKFALDTINLFVLLCLKTARIIQLSDNFFPVEKSISLSHYLKQLSMLAG